MFEREFDIAGFQSQLCIASFLRPVILHSGQLSLAMMASHIVNASKGFIEIRLISVLWEVRCVNLSLVKWKFIPPAQKEL